ncbi:MAG: hypothetical protein M1370_11135 [Bacteroidetes bacterium]|nr:hypothetical protein [Bacteroidota bacterium]MCL5025051.1 hypothetical protein [Chloroflexota bacterium]
MSAQETLYQEIVDLVSSRCGRQLPVTSCKRVAIMVLGMLTSHSCIITRLAREVAALRLSPATADSVERRLRRTLNDHFLCPEIVYQPLLRQLVDWPGALRQAGQLVLAVDETSQEDRVHLFRISLTYQGRAIPLAWALWPQNAPLAPGRYWQAVDGALARAYSLLPKGCDVVVTADRAFDIPAFVDRITALGWQEAKARLERYWEWIVRQRSRPLGKPRPAKENLFTMGLSRCRELLYGGIGHLGQLLLQNLYAPSWSKTWYDTQSYQFI